VFADEPGLVPREMLLTFIPDPLRRSVGRAHTDSGKAALSRPSSQLPAHSLHLALASMSSAGSIEYPDVAADGDGARRNGQISCTPTGTP